MLPDLRPCPRVPAFVHTRFRARRRKMAETSWDLSAMPWLQARWGRKQSRPVTFLPDIMRCAELTGGVELEASHYYLTYDSVEFWPGTTGCRDPIVQFSLS